MLAANVSDFIAGRIDEQSTVPYPLERLADVDAEVPVGFYDELVVLFPFLLGWLVELRGCDRYFSHVAIDAVELRI